MQSTESHPTRSIVQYPSNQSREVLPTGSHDPRSGASRIFAATRLDLCLDPSSEGPAALPKHSRIFAAAHRYPCCGATNSLSGLVWISAPQRPDLCCGASGSQPHCVRRDGLGSLLRRGWIPVVERSSLCCDGLDPHCGALESLLRRGWGPCHYMHRNLWIPAGPAPRAAADATRAPMQSTKSHPTRSIVQCPSNQSREVLHWIPRSPFWSLSNLCCDAAGSLLGS
jgi:hypothetical protein